MGNILIFGSFSVRDWDLLRQRQQTLVDFLVKDFNVFYVERISAKDVGIITVVKALIKRFYSRKKSIQRNRTFQQTLHFIQLKIFPIQKGLFRQINARLSFFQIQKVMKRYDIKFFDSVIVSHPASYVNDIFQKIPARKRIYDCVQRFQFNEYFPPEVIQNDRNIAMKSDMVIADSVTILEEKRQLNTKVLQIPQGIDLVNYNNNVRNSAGIPVDLLPVRNHRVCYVGGFHQSFDFDLVAKLANDIPECTVVLIGKESPEAKKRLRCKNITFLGWKHYTLLPSYMKYMDVFIIPYILNEHSKGVFPTKLFEYLYFKKPVVASALPDILAYKEYVYVANSSNEFIRLVNESLFKGENKLRSISHEVYEQFMRDNSWEARYKDFKNCL